MKVYRMMKKEEFVKLMSGETMTCTGEGFNFVAEKTRIWFDKRTSRVAGPVECAQYMDCIKGNDVLVEFWKPQFVALDKEDRSFYNPFSDEWNKKIRLEILSTPEYSRDYLLPIRARFFGAPKWINLWTIDQNVAKTWSNASHMDIFRTVSADTRDIFNGNIDLTTLFYERPSLQEFSDFFGLFGQVVVLEDTGMIAVLCNGTPRLFNVEKSEFFPGVYEVILG